MDFRGPGQNKGGQSESFYRRPGEVRVEAWTKVVFWNWSSGNGMEIHFGVATILSCQWIGEKRGIQDGSTSLMWELGICQCFM